MKLFIILTVFNFCEARFGDRVISMLHSGVKSKLNPRSKCSRPCQRVPYKIKLEKALLLGGTSPEYLPYITSEQADENGEIDIGQCVGNCRSSIAADQLGIYGSSPNTRMACIPVEYADIKTKIVAQNIIQPGPIIEGLAIVSCACSEITTCN